MDIGLNLLDNSSTQRFLSVQPYSIVSEELYNYEFGRYRTYGILVSTQEGMDILHDVSLCRKTVEDIVELLNKYKLSPIQLVDIISDMLP